MAIYVLSSRNISSHIWSKMSEKLVQWIRDQLNDRDWSQNRLAKEADLTSSQISRIMNGQRPSPEVAHALAKALGVSPDFVLELGGRLPKKQERTPLLEELIGLFFQLPEEDKEAEVATLRVRVERLKKGRQTKHA